MKTSMKYLSAGALSASLLLGSSLTTSCAKRPSHDDSTVSTNSSGRYQMVVAPVGERGSMVFLLDTRERKTWYFQPPQGALINGFWSDIPTLELGDPYWGRIMGQMLTPQVPPGGAGASSLTATQRMSSLPLRR